ncbi:MAG: RagB/SusD family nutrient uptake outer membrane protein [Flavobacteriaceae bacterium]|nr:RagB/SusD family nutrient uptake outer membrane protein [Flavobacteriaceae bacterium]MDG1912782.1 RagB/SusD family nutrient uptake outer membrane protein [Flavobacteriaceae bacterium]
MKNLKTLFVASFAIFAFTVACDDEFLTKEPQASLSGPALANADGVEGKLISAYSTLSGYGMDGGGTWYYSTWAWIFGSISSDDALKGTDAGDQPEHSFIETYDFNTFNVHNRDKWRSGYWGAARANDVILSAEETEDLAATRKAEIIGEAKFIRGWQHFEMQKMYRTPKYVGSENFSLDNLDASKVPNTGKIWSQIEQDFSDAAAALPAVQSQVGRATSWAAKAYLAKAKIFQSDWAGAESILMDIINNGPFELAAKFEDNYLVATRNNSESIFEIQYAVSSADANASNAEIGLAHPYIAPWGCCGFLQAPQDLVDFFQTDANGLPLLDESWKTNHITNPTGANIGEPIGNPSVDPRLDHTVGRPGQLYKRFHIMQVDYIRDLTYAGPYFSKKHVAEPEGQGIGGWGNLTANNFRIMRLGHVILWAAEAKVELGKLEEARALVNRLRARAANPEGFNPGATQGATRPEYTLTGEAGANYNIGEYTAAWTDTATARRAVRYETRLETAMEGNRFFDLQRWGVQAEVLNDYLSRESEYRVYLKGKTFTSPKNQFYPIPTYAIDRSFLDGSPSLTQDPNY